MSRGRNSKARPIISSKSSPKKESSPWTVSRLLLGIEFSAAAAFFLAGCAHAPVQPAEESPAFIEKVCSIGAENHTVKGTAQLRAKSHDASGQFPAFVKAEAATSEHPDQLKVEVQKPFGGAYAILSVNGNQYSVEVPGHPERNRTGEETWGGIPLVWAMDLFLGRVPCPPAGALAQAKIGRTPSGDLLVATADQEFVYHFHPESGPSWPETLHWKRGDLVVDFRFEDVDPHAHSPLKWEASSSRGEIKTHWRDRELH